MNRRWIQLLLVCCCALVSTTAEAYYNPQAGRFIQRDPAGYVDGMNLYEYVKSNPAHNIDPSGHESVDYHLNDFIKPVPYENDSVSEYLTGRDEFVDLIIEKSRGVDFSTSKSFTADDFPAIAGGLVEVPNIGMAQHIGPALVIAVRYRTLPNINCYPIMVQQYIHTSAFGIFPIVGKWETPQPWTWSDYPGPAGLVYGNFKATVIIYCPKQNVKGKCYNSEEIKRYTWSYSIADHPLRLTVSWP